MRKPIVFVAIVCLLISGCARQTMLCRRVKKDMAVNNSQCLADFVSKWGPPGAYQAFDSGTYVGTWYFFGYYGSTAIVATFDSQTGQLLRWQANKI